MAEYLIQDTTLTGIADKIRPLLGLTGTMTPEQMQTNLTTEQANITAALNAIAEKGVTVPAGSNSNALAGLIGAIEAGGGGAKVDTGTITFANANISYYVPIELESKGYAWPDLMFLCALNDSTYQVSSLSQDSGAAAIVCVKKSQASFAPTAYKKVVWDTYVYGYNIGMQKMYLPYTALSASKMMDNASTTVDVNVNAANVSARVGIPYAYCFVWMG